MTKEVAVAKMRNELQRALKLGLDSGEFYVSVKDFEYYLGLIYGVGYDQGKHDMQEKNIMSVIQYDINMQPIKKFHSVTAAANSVKCDRGNLSRTLDKNLKYKGFYWKRDTTHMVTKD